MNTYDILEVTSEYSDFVITEEDKIIDIDGMIEQLTGYNLASKGEIEDKSELLFIQDRIINQLDTNPEAIKCPVQREILAIMYEMIEDMLDEGYIEYQVVTPEEHKLGAFNIKLSYQHDGTYKVTTPSLEFIIHEKMLENVVEDIIEVVRRKLDPVKEGPLSAEAIKYWSM